MNKESVVDKAHRYLTEGRVIVLVAGPGRVVATVRGDAEVHQVAYERGGWRCSCPARGRCAHLLAVGLVTAPTTVRYGLPTEAARPQPRQAPPAQARALAGQPQPARDQPLPVAARADAPPPAGPGVERLAA